MKGAKCIARSGSGALRSSSTHAVKLSALALVSLALAPLAIDVARYAVALETGLRVTRSPEDIAADVLRAILETSANL